jgi:hypothetical protein
VAEVETLRRSRAEEEARLDRAVQARTAAEGALATLERQVRAAEARRADAMAAATADASPRAAPPPASLRPPAAPPASPPPPVASANAAPRIVIHYRAGSPAAQDAARSAAEALRGDDTGGPLPRLELQPVGAVPAQRVVRYFHSEDAAAAARLAGRLGRGWSIQDFRQYEPSPSSQTIEVWLPDR